VETTPLPSTTTISLPTISHSSINSSINNTTVALPTSIKWAEALTSISTSKWVAALITNNRLALGVVVEDLAPDQVTAPSREAVEDAAEEDEEIAPITPPAIWEEPPWRTPP